MAAGGESSAKGLNPVEENVFTFRDEPTVADPIFDYTDSLRTDQVPIVIDNGCYKCRAGWANDAAPKLVFKNVMAKTRGKNKEIETQIGNDISNLEVVRYMLRSQFDKNVVVQYEAQEQIFDYMFNHLGINTSGSVDHPILLTEAPNNPNCCRQQMSELLFECYGVPKVAYGVDAMFSFYNNHPKPATADALIVSCGYQTTHLLPVLRGRLQGQHCRRISIGGAQVDAFMQRLLQLKYPGHTAAVTLSRAEELVHNHTYLANDYLADLSQWAKEDYYSQTVHKFQLPYTASSVAVVNAEQQREKREQQQRRMKEMNARRREERIAAEQEKLQQLLNVQELLEGEDEETCERTLDQLGYNSSTELHGAIISLSKSINKQRNKMIADESDARGGQSLLGIPDEGLTPEQREQKKRQKMLKTAADAKKARLEKREPLPPARDMTAWIEDTRKQRQDLLTKRSERKQRKADMTKRRTHASQQRMKIITELAQGTRKKKDDTFGANDEDWNVYKTINKDAGDSDSEAEQEKLEELENLLRQHDPDFKDPNEPEPVLDVKEYYRLYVGIERIRTPELLFQPSMIGVEQAGVAETMDFVLKKFSAEEQDRLSQHVFLTGGCASFPGFKERMETELLAMRPFQSKFNVFKASDPSRDAWSGASKWALTPAFQEASITRAEYEENGGEYLKEHLASNRYVPTPAAIVSKEAEADNTGT